MRSPREIGFRLRQELRNVQLLAFPPTIRNAEEFRSPLSGLPNPTKIANQLRSSAFANQVTSIADKILQHRFPIFGGVLETGKNIDWRRDYVNKLTTEPKFLRLVPYLDASRAGDHKNVWELNRHQHLVLLAQAFLMTGTSEYVGEVASELQDWWAQNPFQRGINWTSALEVAFRAYSWIWVYHLIANHLPVDVRRQLIDSLYQHGLHLENNLSFYFSPNTHLLGEAVVLHALGRLFPAFPCSKRWITLGGNTVEREMERQVHSDGSHFEQSTYYHVYALDMFLFYGLLSKPTQAFRIKLSSMADFLHSLLGESRTLTFLGDDDGGRWFHPYGPRDQFGRASLASCSVFFNTARWAYSQEDLHPQAAWWLGQTGGSANISVTSQRFPDSGLTVMQAGANQIVVDAGPFGPGRAGHSHSDTLSIVVRAGNRSILVDSGTYTYVGDIKLRNRFRGSASHNTVRIDSQNQATPVGPFWWVDKPMVNLLRWSTTEQQDDLSAEAIYRGFTHRRRVLFVKPKFVLVVDFITGTNALEHDVEQWWQLASLEAEAHFFTAVPSEPVEGWQSTVFASKQAIPTRVVRSRTTLPASFAAAIALEEGQAVAIQHQPEQSFFEFRMSGFPEVLTLSDKAD